MQAITKKIATQPAVTITYFIPDTKKDGGAYITVSGNIKKIDKYKNITSCAKWGSVNESNR